MTALSSAIGEAFVCKLFSIFFLLCLAKKNKNKNKKKPALSADPLLVWNYGVMAVLAFVTGFVFWWSVRDLDAKEDELNELAEGHVHS